MMLCLCHPFSDKKLKAHLETKTCGTATVGEAYKTCSGGNKPQCCTCLATVKEMVKSHNKAMKSMSGQPA